ncbi:cytochrome P450 [Bradyrhizobium barranii]|uniref:Cytochrome P450 n=1 Tax=Bradyrhizobium barranii TaxID=2992140 RepID=A0ABY3QS19_9BRAD|nr:cytochrome P450 [Bradyrhizobium japonicum]UFW88376.1 cytochrome P450 [Bradyrhizobium japonicum]
MRQIDNLRPSIARIVAPRLDGMASALERGEGVDLHRGFALAVSMLVFAELFGLSRDDMFGLAAGIGAIVEGLAPHASDRQLAAADAGSARVQARSPALRRARARVQAWCDRGEVSILRETGDLMLKLIFSFMGIPAQDLPGWHRKYRQLLQLIVAPPVDLPGLPLRRGRAARDWIDAQLRQFVRDARAHAARTGLINDMVSAFDRSDDALSDDVLVANIRLLLLGGHDTTASTMAWIVIELARQPVLWDALVEEAQRVGAVPTRHADLAQCPVAEALFRETLRVHPPTTLVLRRALQELQLGQRRIPAGTHLCIPLLHFSTSALLHEAPDQFRLARWLQRTGPIRPVDMLQFATGPHVCIGYHLVWLELVQFCIALALTMHKAGVRPRLLSGVEKGRRYYPTAHPSMTVRIGFS